MQEERVTALGVLKSIDHVAIAVLNADDALPYYTEHLGLEVVGDEIADDPGVRLVYLAAGEDRVQLVQPIRDGPVAEWIDLRGEGLHHICFEVESIPAALQELPKQHSVRQFRGGRSRYACFLDFTPSGVNIELTETQSFGQYENHNDG